jgi:hypothetical protein
MFLMTLVVPWFVPRHAGKAVHLDRLNELVRAQGRNVQNPRVGNPLHLACATEDAYHLPPCATAHRHRQRPTFADLFALASRLAGDGAVACVANADVWFDQSLDALDARGVGPGEVIALSRDDHGAGKTEARQRTAETWSQDAWIFRAPLLLPGLDFSPGQPGCDNRLAWELVNVHGKDVVNLCRDIRLRHEHRSGFRTARGRDAVQPPYLGVPPRGVLS